MIRRAAELGQHRQLLDEREEGATDAALCAQVALETLRAAVLAVRTADCGRKGAAVVPAAGCRAAGGVPGANVAVFARAVQKFNFHRVDGQMR